MQQPERFTIGLTPVPTAQRVARQRTSLWFRVGSALVSLAILIVLLVFFNPGLGQGWTTTIVLVWVLTTAVWMTISAVGFRRAKRDLALIGTGDAVILDAHGIEYVFPCSVRAAWRDVTAIKVTGPAFGAGPVLQTEVAGQPVAKVPVSFLDAMPSAIDSAVSAYSLGRVRLDVSDLDRML